MISTNEPRLSIPSSDGFSQRLREYILEKHGSVNSFCRKVDIKYPAQMTDVRFERVFHDFKEVSTVKVD